MGCCLLRVSSGSGCGIKLSCCGSRIFAFRVQGRVLEVEDFFRSAALGNFLMVWGWVGSTGLLVLWFTTSLEGGGFGTSGTSPNILSTCFDPILSR